MRKRQELSKTLKARHSPSILLRIIVICCSGYPKILPLPRLVCGRLVPRDPYRGSLLLEKGSFVDLGRVPQAEFYQAFGLGIPLHG